MPDSTSRGTTFLTRTRLILLALFGLGVMLWLGAATLVTRHLLHPPFLDGAYGDVIIAGEKPQLGVNPKSCCDAAFENLRLTDGAGASIDAWFVPGTVPAAVLLIPASGASKRAMLPYLRFLNAVGLPILVVDSSDFVRGRAGWGWTERGIISGAVGILQQKGYRNIAALGVSEGAATALMAQAENPQLFKAIVADGSFATLGAMLRRNPSLAALNPAFLQTVIWELGFALGKSVDEISPAVAASKLGDCALLVIQNAKDPLTPESDGGKILAMRANPSSTIYLSTSAGHGDSIYVDPQGYQKAVLDFLAHNLPGAETIAPR